MNGQPKTETRVASIGGAAAVARRVDLGSVPDKERDGDLENILYEKVAAAADAYSAAIKSMHSFPPRLTMKEARMAVEEAFRELQRAREEHILCLLQLGGSSSGEEPALIEPTQLEKDPGVAILTPEAELLKRLTFREIEILRMVGEGKRSKEIAHHLAISPKTVITHRAHIMNKLRIHESASLVRFAIRSGLCKA
jgi:DNA-binding NarL/FixJ family response regulator